jgi:hypothetical protein
MRRTARWDDAGVLLAPQRKVEAAGADFLLLCTNTRAQGRERGCRGRGHPAAAMSIRQASHPCA